MNGLETLEPLIYIPLESVQPPICLGLSSKLTDSEICKTEQALALRTYRKKMGLSIAELSRQTGIKVHVLERYDIGKNSISYENAVLLSNFLGVELEKLLDDHLKFIYCGGCDEFMEWFNDRNLDVIELTKSSKYRHLREPLLRVLDKDFSRFNKVSYEAIIKFIKI